MKRMFYKDGYSFFSWLTWVSCEVIEYYQWMKINVIFSALEIVKRVIFREIKTVE